jgi:branched-chain amino acid transport system permease protein
MNQFIVALADGASIGGTLALIGLGLVLAFRATETFNFAHGQLMLLPAFVIGRMQVNGNSSYPFVVQLAISLIIVGTIGVLFYVLVLRRTTGLPVFMGIIATLGLAAILDGAMTLIFGSRQYNVNTPGLPHGVVTIGGARVSSASLTLTVFTLVLAGAVALWLRMTRAGTSIRAAGQNAVLASQGGINVRRVYIASWGLAAALAGVAGIAYSSVSVADPSMVNLGLAAIPAIMLGGLDSIEGAVVGGFAIGILQGFTASYFGGQYVAVTTYGVLLVVLLTFPQGFFGTKQVARA